MKPRNMKLTIPLSNNLTNYFTQCPATNCPFVSESTSSYSNVIDAGIFTESQRHTLPHLIHPSSIKVKSLFIKRWGSKGRPLSFHHEILQLRQQVPCLVCPSSAFKLVCYLLHCKEKRDPHPRTLFLLQILFRIYYIATNNGACKIRK